MKIVLFLFITAFGANVFAQSEKQGSKIKMSVLEVMNSQIESWNRGDIEGFMQGYWKSEDLRFVSGNGVYKGWQAAFDRYRVSYDTPEKMGTLSFTEIEVTVLSRKSAFVKGRFILERTQDKPTGLFTLVFRKIDGAWKIVHDHTST